MATINFEIRSLPNHSLVKAKVVGIELVASFDTGQYGLLKLEDKAKKILTEMSLIKSVGVDAYDDEVININ